MPNNPVQVILNTRDYFVAPEAGRFGPSTDFFEGRDQEFVQHREKLIKQVTSISTAFQQSGASSGVLKVSLRREAWAKSHRPQRALFPPSKRPCIAVSNLGELYYHVTADDVRELASEITAAENETRRRVSAKTGKEYVAPSDQRSDAGAVESIELPAAADKRRFNVEEAIRWLSDARTSGAYFVELFSPPPTYISALIVDYHERVLATITSGAREHGLTVETFPVDLANDKGARPTGVVAVRLVSAGVEHAFSTNVEDHGQLLRIFDSHPYVRRVVLPPLVMAARVQSSSAATPEAEPAPLRQSGRVYPKVGVIDGGVGDQLNPWKLGSHTVVSPEHQQLDHGSFIAGLLVAGQQLNGSAVCNEADGCELFDIGVLPDSDQQPAFETYYPKGIVDFLEELDAGVETAHRDHGVRIFNMSLNVMEPVESDSYGVVASLVDRIADKHDVVFVISAGNLRPTDCRAEWSADPQIALQYLASRTVAETLLQPAESSRSIAVGALNPPGCAPRVAGAPTTYTRRGPGLRVGVKPDVSHFGGATPDSGNNTGLQSWNAAGALIAGHGTSYATPLVAKSLATLESRVASPLSRELLIAMLIHGCRIPGALTDESLSEVARQFTGFGIPKSSDEMLFTDDHAITLVFSDVLHALRELQFDFAWPHSLVNPDTGACRGEAHMTLVYRPPLNRDFGAEFVRVNVDAHLRQEDGDTFSNRTKQAFLPEESEEGQFEYELIRHGLKWWPTKVYRARFPQGKGKSSNWRMSVESLVRAEEAFPSAGIPFSLILSISDIKGAAPVFNDVRLHLTSRNVQIADIRATTQVRVQP
jgi:hypothetical protein